MPSLFSCFTIKVKGYRNWSTGEGGVGTSLLQTFSNPLHWLLIPALSLYMASRTWCSLAYLFFTQEFDQVKNKQNT